ncbi:MAG: PAAR-like domain-containing protein, partial [Pseudoalteromonas rhizosphaerae]
MPYINAAAGKQTGSVQYDIDALSADVRTGGSVTWRHNNSTLLGLNNSARSNGALGKANGIAIFEDKASGDAAFLAEIARPKYREKTLGEMVNIFIPDYIIPPPQWDSQKNEPRLPWNEPQTNMDVNKPVSNAQAFLDLVSTHLGWQAGNQEQLIKDTASQAPQVQAVSGQNVLINGRTAVHQDSGGKLMTVDVCLTTIGTSVVPIPYANKAQSSDVTDVASSVKVNGNGAANINSTFSQSSGDSPGDKKGVASKKND